jgi:orotate phosphoribosyltransferase
VDAVHGAALSVEAKRARLLEIIKQRSLRFGDFVLRSGKRSNFFLDGKGTTLSAEGAALVGEVLFDAIRDLDVDAVGGLTLGADPIATAVSVESWRQGKPIDAFIVRKETKDHGLGDLIAGTLKPASRVVIVEDTVTTGSAIQAAIDAVRAAGHTVVKVIAIVDRRAGASETFARQGLDYGWIFTLEDLGVQQALDDFPAEFAEEQRRNAEELKALRLPADVEPPTIFRP